MEGIALNSSRSYFNSIPAYEKSFLKLEKALDVEMAMNRMQLDLIEERENISFMEADLRVLVENGSYDMMNVLYEEATENTAEKKKNAISRMFDAIVKFFKNLIDNIKEKIDKVFTKKKLDNFTAEDWEKAGAKDLWCNIDYEKKMNELNSKLSEGERLMQFASGATGIPEAKVKGYVKSCEDLVHNIPKITIKVAGLAAAGTGIYLAGKNFRKIVGGLLNTAQKGMETCDRVKDKWDDRKDVKSGVHVVMENEAEIAKAMSDVSKAQGNILNRVALSVVSVVDHVTKGTVDPHIKAGAAAADPNIYSRKAKFGEKLNTATGKKFPKESKKKIMDRINKEMKIDSDRLDKFDAKSKAFSNEVDKHLKDLDLNDDKSVESVISKIRQTRKKYGF